VATTTIESTSGATGPDSADVDAPELWERAAPILIPCSMLGMMAGGRARMGAGPAVSESPSRMRAGGRGCAEPTGVRRLPFATAAMTVARTAGRRRRRVRYLPPQHGAWAFLGLPLILGALTAPGTVLLVPLAVAWVCAYPLSYAVLGMIRSPRPERYRRPALVWGAVVAPPCLVLVAAQPWLLGVGAAFAALLAVNAVYARRNDERALVNDLVLIVECSSIIPLMWGIGSAASSPTGRPELPVPNDVWLLALLCGLVLAGSTLHVKSLIRERTNPLYATASKAFALTCLPVGMAIAWAWGLPEGWWLVVPFVVLAARAWRPARGDGRPGVIGAIELVCFIVTSLAAVFAVMA
jgi:hypothetical protein